MTDTQGHTGIDNEVILVAYAKYENPGLETKSGYQAFFNMQ